jgi:hypothetical protein
MSINTKKGNGIVGIIIIIAIIWGLYAIFSDDNSSGSSYESDYDSSYDSDCSNLEPENPYSSGTGHYAGYEWAENKGVSSCGGNSDSFIEGCEEYLSQEEAFENCN